jgi:FtsP/CotA-like multicopper oxidase with cupredoxin domain
VLRLAALDSDNDPRYLQQIASDGGLLARPERVRDVLLPPGGRAEIVVDGTPTADQNGGDGSGAQRLRLTALPYSVNADGSGASRNRTLLSIDLPGGPQLPPLPQRLGDVPTSTRTPPSAPGRSCSTPTHRRLHHRRPGPSTPTGPTSPPELDTLEIWEIANAHTVDHPFHLHSYRVQLLDTDGRPPRTGPGSTPSTSAADRPSAWPSPSPASPAAPSTTATSPTTRTSA